MQWTDIMYTNIACVLSKGFATCEHITQRAGMAVPGPLGAGRSLSSASLIFQNISTWFLLIRNSVDVNGAAHVINHYMQQ